MISRYSDTQLFFYELVQRAQTHLPYSISENTESYIVFMLSDLASGCTRYTNEPLFEIFRHAIEIDHPESFKEFRRLGDHSLITLSIFPDNVHRRNVSKDYFRSMGQMGYNRAGEIAEKVFDRDFKYLYQELADSFRAVESIIRRARGLTPLSVVDCV